MIMKLTAFWKWIYPALRLMRTADLFMMEGGEHKEYLPCTPYESWLNAYEADELL